LVVEFIGSSVNSSTGDYSRGATGFWIENGEIQYPVSEITIAGNLKTMFASLEAANDLIFKGSVNAPSCLIESMTIAGR
jgi:PmbA protein